MKTHSQEIRKEIWQVWITDEDFLTHTGEMESQKQPTHYEILALYEALPTLFKVVL